MPEPEDLFATHSNWQVYDAVAAGISAHKARSSYDYRIPSLILVRNRSQ